MRPIVPATRPAAGLLAAAVLAACAHAGGNFPVDVRVRPATDAPAAFVVAGASADAAPGDGTCRSPLRDPRTGAEYRFVRAQPGVGDYAVPEGTYGARAGELLRIDCRSWRALGFVPR